MSGVALSPLRHTGASHLHISSSWVSDWWDACVPIAPDPQEVHESMLATNSVNVDCTLRGASEEEVAKPEALWSTIMGTC